MSQRSFLLGLVRHSLLLLSAHAAATTRDDALAMPSGTWPAHLACTKNEDGTFTGQREEEIAVTDAPGEGNVLTRTFTDPTTCGA